MSLSSSSIRPSQGHSRLARGVGHCRWIGLAVAAAAGMVLADAPSAQAQAPFGFGFQPFGFYQPYGVQFRSSVPTPPYFALNPPVYYGTRHYRPYGVSPFASPPQVGVPATYEAIAEPRASQRPGFGGPVSNPFICQRDPNRVTGSLASASGREAVASAQGPTEPGAVRRNPFVAESTTELVSL